MRRVALLALTLALCWTLMPLVPLLLWSVGERWPWPALAPERWSLRAWQALLDPTARAVPALLTGAGLALAVTALALATGVPAAYTLAGWAGRWRGLVEALVFAPLLVPPLAVAMGLQVVFIRLGLADTVPGVVLAHLIFAVPYVVLILTGAFSALGPGWSEQARSLGGSPWQTFWLVLLPLVHPALAVAALLAFLVSWSQYALTVLIGGGRVFTPALLVVAAARGSDTSLAAAATLLFVAPTLAFLLLAGRSLDERAGGQGLL